LVRLLRDGGLTYRAIAEKFECSLWTVRDIVKYWTRA
jgi:transposase